MIKVGLVGAGFMGEMHANCHIAAKGGKLAAVCDVRKENAKKLADLAKAEVFTDYDKMLAEADIDMVDVCLPTNMHADAVVKAAKAGKHVLCEKPIALTLKDADRMIAACEKAGVQFMVAQVIRFWPEYQLLKKYFDSGELGKLRSLQMKRLSPPATWSWKNWLNDPKLSGSALIDLHIHDADFARYLLGDPIKLDSVGTGKKGAWSHIWTNYAYKGVAVHAEGGWDFPSDYPFCMAYRAIFEKGTLDFDCTRTPTVTLYTGTGKPKHPKPPKPRIKGKAGSGNIADLGGYGNEIQYFLDCLNKGEAPAVTTAKDARDSLALVLKELKSADAKAK